jgi:hypothetical protein
MVSQPETDRAAAIDDRVVANDVIRRLQRDQLPFPAAPLEQVLLDDRERASARGAEIVAAGPDGLMAVLAASVDDIAKVVVIDAIVLRTDQSGIIAADKDGAPGIHLAFEAVVVDAVMSAPGADHVDPMLHVPRPGTLVRAKTVAGDLNVLAVLEKHRWLVGVVRQNKPFQREILAFVDDKARRALNHGLPAMFGADHDPGLGRAAFPLDADRSRRLVDAIGQQDRPTRAEPLYRRFEPIHGCDLRWRIRASVSNEQANRDRSEHAGGQCHRCRGRIHASAPLFRPVHLASGS